MSFLGPGFISGHFFRIYPSSLLAFYPSSVFLCVCSATDHHVTYVKVSYQPETFDIVLKRHHWDLLEVLVLSGGADLGRVALGQFVQASGILKLELSLSAEELL